jgi:hypothetical protein
MFQHAVLPFRRSLPLLQSRVQNFFFLEALTSIFHTHYSVTYQNTFIYTAIDKLFNWSLISVRKHVSYTWGGMEFAWRGLVFVNVEGKFTLRLAAYCNVQTASRSHLALCFKQRVRGHEIENNRSLPSVVEFKENLKIYFYSSNVSLTAYLINILKHRRY